MKLPLLVLSICVGYSSTANILAMFPHPGKSHFDVFEPLILELADRGHQVTMLSFFPQKVPRANLTEISLTNLGPLLLDFLKFDQVIGMGSIMNYKWVSDIGHDVCKDLLKSDEFQNVLKSGKKYDLVIMEWFNTDCFFTLPKFFSVPFIGFSSCKPFPYHNRRVGNPDSLAINSNVFFPMSTRMTFFERVINVLATLGMQIATENWYSAQEQKLISEALGETIDVQKIASEVSLLFSATHYSLQGAMPRLPNVIEVGGIHIQPAKPLTRDLEKFLNESTGGVLLFSMGSVLRSASFPEDKRQAFMDAFKELPVQVLMKWENDTLPGKPDNVRLSKWLPQRDVLAHPNVVAFMGHGGLLSTSEAVYCGVPMVLMPMFGDQPNNVAHLVSTGAAIKLDFEAITKQTVLEKLRAVVFDKSYRENAKLLSERYRDRPMSPLDTAVYWTEYVIRHKGATHLRSVAVEMPWYQLWLLDVILFLLTTCVLTLLTIGWLFKKLLSVFSKNPTKHPHKKKD